MHSDLPIHKSDPIDKYQFMHHFVPHPKHKKRATLLSNNAFKFYIFLLLINFLALRITPKVVPGILGYASSIYVQELLSETNKVRREHGLEPLTINADLSQAAQQKANHMFENDYWAHVAPDGTRPWDFILGQQYDYEYAGENLAKNFNTSKQVVDAWFDSESHRDNLLNKNYTEIGFAVVNGELDGYDTTLVVQMFGKPRVPNYQAAGPTNPPTTEVPATAPETEVLDEVGVEVTPAVTQEPLLQQNEAVQVHPEQNEVVIDVGAVSRYMILIFGVFFVGLLSLDIWYSHRKGIAKFTGHTFAHMLFLILILTSVLISLSPGRVL